MSLCTGFDRTLVVTTVKANGKGKKILHVTQKLRSIQYLLEKKNKFMGFKVWLLQYGIFTEYKVWIIIMTYQLKRQKQNGSLPFVTIIEKRNPYTVHSTPPMVTWTSSLLPVSRNRPEIVMRVPPALGPRAGVTVSGIGSWWEERRGSGGWGRGV